MYRPRFPPPCGPRPAFNNPGQPRFNRPMNPRFDGPPHINGHPGNFQPRPPDHRGHGMMHPLSPGDVRPPDTLRTGHLPPFHHPNNVWSDCGNVPGPFEGPRGGWAPPPGRFLHRGSPGDRGGRFPGPRGSGPPPPPRGPGPRPMVRYGDLEDPSKQHGPHAPGMRGRGGGWNQKRHHWNQGHAQAQGDRTADQGPKAKKQRVDKRELPENNQYYCETCDRGFKTAEKHKIHVDGHEQCSVEGCAYKAAPKLVSLHFRWQHSTGLAKKIWQLESKEDIEKWRAERRTNFPTAVIIAKKEALMKERKKRGEILDTKTFGKMRGRGRGRGGRGGRGRDGGQDNVPRTTQTPKTDEKENENDSNTISPTEEKKKEGDPLSFVLSSQNAKSESDAEDGEIMDSGNATTESSAVVAAGGLGNLLASYGDVSDSNDDEKPAPEAGENPVICDKPSPPNTEEAENPKKEKEEEDKKTEEKRHGRRQRRSRGKGRSKTSRAELANPKRKPTLLEKLLAPDIRHERNVILQCVRYIVRSNFLGVGSKPLPASEQLTPVKS